MTNFIEQVRNIVRRIVGRGVISGVYGAENGNGYSVDVSLPGGETHSKTPFIQQYGIASKPNKESEVVVLFPGGARDNGVVVASMGDPSKIPDLQVGEVAVFSEFGQTLILKNDGSIQIRPKDGKNVVVDSPLDVTGDVSVGGSVSIDKTLDVTQSVTATGEIKSNADVKAGIISLSTHVHGVPGITPGEGATTSSTPT